MECQNIINFLDSEVTHPSKFTAKSWNGINDDAQRTHYINSQVTVLILQC